MFQTNFSETSSLDHDDIASHQTQRQERQGSTGTANRNRCGLNDAAIDHTISIMRPVFLA